MPKISGSCLCGSAKYESHAEPVMTAVCHCANCQKQTGTAFSIIVGVPEDSLVFESEDTIAEYLDSGESGGAVHRRFCQKCGSPLLSLVDSVPGVGFIKAGTLDDKSWLNPTSHIWCSSAQSWLDLGSEIPVFPRNPG